MDATAKKKLSDEELYAQMRWVPLYDYLTSIIEDHVAYSTLLLAGHETTATTLAFMLLELARNPKVQSRLRREIRMMDATVKERGNSELTVTDLEGMPYLNAVIKEGLRLHPVEAQTLRIASQDDILPLSKPILTTSGKLIHEVLVPAGTEVVISLAAYNR